MAIKRDWKQEIGYFGAYLRRLTDQLTNNTSKYQKYILTDDENYYGTQQI